MRNYLFYFSILMCFSAFGEGPIMQKKANIEKLPHNFELLSNDKLIDFNPIEKAAIQWPAQTILRDHLADLHEINVLLAERSTLDWASKILRSEYVPELSDVEFFPLNNDIDGCDAVRFRYRIDHYAIQYLSLSDVLIVTIKDFDSSALKSHENAQPAFNVMNKFLDKVFKEAGKLKKTIAASSVLITKNGVKGKHNLNSAPSAWWDLASWWTDGQVMIVVIPKVDDDRPAVPSRKKEWFSLAATTKR